MWTIGAVGRIYPAEGVVVSSTGQQEGFTVRPRQAQEEWQELQPSLARVGRLEELV